ncbi:hypothetical protein D3C84_455360 [compost metagenome]
MGGEQQAVEQQGVGRHRGVAQAGALHREQEEHQLQRQGADEDVAVHRQQRTPTAPAGQRPGCDPPRMAPQRTAGQRQAGQRSAPLGHHGRLGGAGHAPVQPQHEPQRQGDVDQVGGQEDRQRRAGILGTEEPAHQCIVGQRRRQSQQAQVEELAGHLVQLRRGRHQRQGEVAEGDRQQAQQQRQQHGQPQALQQHLAQRATIGAPGGLGGKTGSAHAQETEHADHQGVEGAAHRHRAQLVGMGQVADHRAVHQRHHGHGNVREDHGRGQCPDLPVGRGMPPGVEQRTHAGLQSGGAV